MPPSRLPLVVLLLVLAATAWSMLLLGLALTLPIETVQSDHAGLQPRETLVAVNGLRVLLFVAVPLAVTLLVGLLLLLARRTGWRPVRALAWGLASLLLAGAVVGFLTFLIGIFVVPGAGLLVAACAVTSAGAGQLKAGRTSRANSSTRPWPSPGQPQTR